VGVAATFLASGRAMATKDPRGLINDPFPEPLVRAVGLDFFTKMMDGELDLDAIEKRVRQLPVVIPTPEEGRTLWRVGYYADPLGFTPLELYQFSHRFDDIYPPLLHALLRRLGGNVSPRGASRLPAEPRRGAPTRQALRTRGGRPRLH
jgi:hypothetical protein